MSHQEEDSQVDFVPESEQEPADEFTPRISCKRCIHKDVCFFLTSLDRDRQAFEMSGVCRLPYDINILATTCNKFDDGRTKAEKLTEDDTAEAPEESTPEAL